jgi:hypothetical protein
MSAERTLMRCAAKSPAISDITPGMSAVLTVTVAYRPVSPLSAVRVEALVRGRQAARESRQR